MSKLECKVLTYNVLHDVPAFRHVGRRVELVAGEIAAERPHLIALQEVSRGPAYGDIGAALCARVNAICGGEPYRIDYARADGLGGGEHAFEDGVALMSRLRPAAAPEVLRFDSQVRLSAEFAGHRYRLPDDRVAMRARYHLAGGTTVQACVTHLTDRGETIDGIPARHLQARELIGWLDHQRDRSLPIVLAGDFNDVPDSQTIATITGAGFIDLWQAAGDGSGFTNDRDDLDLESPYAEPNQRIDYLFLGPDQSRNYEIAGARLFLDRPRSAADGGWLWGSDHIGVIATIRL